MENGVQSHAAQRQCLYDLRGGSKSDGDAVVHIGVSLSEFHVRRSTVTGILKGMEKKGLIQRLSVEEDARLKRIVLTSQAKSLHREVEMAVARMEEIALRGLSEAEIEVFLEILEKMKANLQEDMLTYEEQKGE